MRKILCSVIFVLFASSQAVALEVSLGGGWNGAKVPAGQQCKLFKGNGSTPPMKVTGIPKEADAIVVEFNDLSYGPLSKKGGHGVIGFSHNGSSSASLPAVKGYTSKPGGSAWLVSRARSTGDYASTGYLPPCSGGRGNSYQAIVHAVKLNEGSKTKYKVLASQKINIGKY
jgi:hypothetical protein